jgi:hypothetical protein
MHSTATTSVGPEALGANVSKLGAPAFAIGVALLGAALALGNAQNDGFSHAMHSYLVAFCYFLSLSLGALFFVLLQHLTGSTWSVTVRRVAEITAAGFPLLALLLLPILIPLLQGSSALYLWNDAKLVQADELLHKKHAYLNASFFAIRCVVYFAVWIGLSSYFLSKSVAQDKGGEPGLTLKMRTLSAPGMLLFALTVTFAAFDLLMSLNPHWYSTIFGVYYFAGCVVGFFSLLALLCIGLQKAGMLRDAITVEHRHDIGKLLFAFVFFWGYIAFSQFMLIWYANLPEETVFFQQRAESGWYAVSMLLLFGHFLIPFVGLISRHPKRCKVGLSVFAVLMLVMHWVDLYWLVLPNYSVKFKTEHLPLHLLDLLTFAGVACLFAGNWIRLARRSSLVAHNDPQIAQSLAFQNH